MCWCDCVLDRYYLELHHSDMRSRDGRRNHFMVVTWILVCFFLRLGWNFLLGVILFVLSHFTSWCNQINLCMTFLRLCWNFRLGVTLSWCHFMSWCNQLNLGMICLRFAKLCRFSVILSDLVSYYILNILVQWTASRCDLCVLVGDFFST